MTWNKFLSLLVKHKLIESGDNFSFEGNFGDITEYGPTSEIVGYYHSKNNFFFDFLGTPNKYGNSRQVQITSDNKNNIF